MAASLKPEELGTYRRRLEDLARRLRGDVDRMAAEALGRNHAESGLSSVPMHLADVGTDNYDQEFTLGLIENENETLKMIDEALARVADGSYGVCSECGQPIARARLQALPYARHCIECARKLENPA